jgi:DNA polymerase III subunit delta
VKYDNIRLLEKHLNESAPKHAPFYFVIGKELHESQEAVQLILKFLSPSKSADYIFEAFQINENQLWMELESPSFFAETRVIWIQQADKLKKSIQEQLEKYFLRPSPAHYLIFTASTAAKQHSFYQLGNEKGVILELPDVKQWEKEKKAVEWISHQASAVRKTMAYPVCQLLVKQIGLDYALLSQEMTKLLCYCDDKAEITAQDVQAICSVLSIDSVFQLGEAIFRRDAVTALRTLQTLFTDGQVALPLLRQIRSQFQTSYQVALLLAQERPAQEITKEFPYMKGQILDRQVQQAQNYGLKAFQEGLLKIDKTEYQLKNSLADPHLLIELLIIQLIRRL